MGPGMSQYLWQWEGCTGFLSHHLWADQSDISNLSATLSHAPPPPNSGLCSGWFQLNTLWRLRAQFSGLHLQPVSHQLLFAGFVGNCQVGGYMVEKSGQTGMRMNRLKLELSLLFSVQGPSIMGLTPCLAWQGHSPPNWLPGCNMKPRWSPKGMRCLVGLCGVLDFLIPGSTPGLPVSSFSEASPPPELSNHYSHFT